MKTSMGERLVRGKHYKEHWIINKFQATMTFINSLLVFDIVYFLTKRRLCTINSWRKSNAHITAGAISHHPWPLPCAQRAVAKVHRKGHAGGVLLDLQDAFTPTCPLLSEYLAYYPWLSDQTAKVLHNASEKWEIIPPHVYIIFWSRCHLNTDFSSIYELLLHFRGINFLLFSCAEGKKMI